MKRKLRLNKETLCQMELGLVIGGTDTGDGCFVSRAFSNCTYCNTKTKWKDCVQITQQ